MIVPSFGALKTLSSSSWPLPFLEVMFLVLDQPAITEQDLGSVGHLFVIPFAKSATTGQYSPVSTILKLFVPGRH